MRQDMFKVIVERPRTGGSFAKKGRFDAGVPDEDSPAREALRKHRRTKCLNENLSPLERYLHSQVGRPWDRVYAEICERIDRRSTVQQHIHQHIGGFVAIDVRAIGGELVQLDSWRGAPQPLSVYSAPALYVDPRSRLLRINRLREAARRREPVAADADRRVLDARTELQHIGGVWYEVKFAMLPAGATPETPLRFAVLPEFSAPRYSRAPCHHRVACAKRQLGRAELRERGLDNGEGR